MSMRTTLTIEPSVAQKLRKRMREKNQTLKLVVNEALREGLRALDQQPQRKPRIRIIKHAFGFRPGIDLSRLNKLADELEDEELIARMKR